MICSSVTDRAEAFKALGSKAWNLAKMKETGFYVPDFICITKEELDNLEAVAEALRKTCPKASAFAVRSSANVEDGSSYTFAGQFQTFLNVSKEDLPRRARECFLAACSPTVRGYCSHTGTNAGSIEMSVIIQAMVKSQISGVLFTANPLGILSEMVIVAGQGLGEGIVGGRTPVSTYYYNREDGLGYEEKQESAPDLSKEQRRLLLDTALLLEGCFGPALDIEYAFENGSLRLLQLRPITTLSDTSPLVLDNSNIAESYPGITLPLTMSFIHKVYGDLFESLLKRLTGNASLVRRSPQIYRELVAGCNGRVYYNINHWYAVLKLLPFSHKIIPVWQDMLGVTSRELPKDLPRVDYGIKLKVIFHTVSLFITIPGKMKRLEKAFEEMKHYYDAHYRKGLSYSQLWRLYSRMNRLVLKQWDLTLVNDMYSFLYTALLKSALRHQGMDAVQLNDRIAGISNLTSMKPVCELIQLALLYKREGQSCAFKKRFFRYINDFGDRTVGELKLETHTYREKPDLLMEQVKAYAGTEGLEDLARRLSQGISVLSGGPVLSFLTKRASLGIYNRESSRMNRSRLYGYARRLFLDMGELLAQEGKLKEPRDVFYLTMRELYTAPKRKSFCSIVEKRQRKYSFFHTLPAYKRIVFDERVINKTGGGVRTCPQDSAGDRQLSGTPCSSGKVRGPVLIIKDPSQACDTSGKILVTVSTDPGWVFLLARAAGIISEKGSLLSHTAIIARELKIPAIVGIPHITELVKNGDMVELDCETGLIHRL